jgi:hypothetical protein
VNNVMLFIVDFILKRLLSKKDGRGWFSKVVVEQKSPNLIITGKHELGPNFSIFIKNYFNGILSAVKHTLKMEKIGKQEGMFKISIKMLHDPDEKFNIEETLSKLVLELKERLNTQNA